MSASEGESGITVEERHKSRKAGNDYREYAYIITGTAGEVEALNAVPGAQYITVVNPATTEVLILEKKVSVEQEIDGDNIRQHTWYATVRYEPVDTDEDGGSSNNQNYSISVTTNTANVKVALHQSRHLAMSETDPGEFGNWIGVVKNGAGYDVQGVDCIFPQATLEIEKRYSRAAWNTKVLQVIRKVGMVNSEPFLVFDEEEVLFAGARVVRGARNITVTYQFYISLGDEVEVPGIGAVAKKGWRYLWVFSRPDTIGAKAVAAYVARVYKRTDYSQIL